MNRHQENVNSEHGIQTMFGEWQVSAAIEYVIGETADSDLRAKKLEVAMFHEAGHQGVAFTGDVQANPNERQLGVNQVQSE